MSSPDPTPMTRSTSSSLSSRYKSYPRYKDSGVEWLGDIPDHWGILRVGDNARLINGFPFDSAQFDLNDGLPLVRIRDLENQTTEVRYAGESIEEARITTGDIVVGMDGNFAVARWRGGDALLNQRLCSLHPKPTIDSAFLFYLLGTPLQLINDLTHSTTVKHLSSSQVTKTRFGCPPTSEQRVIAEFLDQETAKIDNLIAKKERLIELLEEKRAALITHAVTRGLNPDAPLRDSGIEWLGQIPTHWEVRRLKYVTTKIGSGKTPRGGADAYVTSGVLFLRSQNVQFSGLQLDDVAFIDDRTDAEMAATRATYDDVLLNITGASLGRCCLVVDSRVQRANVSQHVCIIRPAKSKILPAFLNAVIASEAVQTQIFAGEVGVSREGLSFQDVGVLRLPLPKLSEQQQIIAEISKLTSALEITAKAIFAAIDRLKEYRAALITAAVTGKIDVRDKVKAAA
jgi:type I restriction enzyme S subunit